MAQNITDTIPTPPPQLPRKRDMLRRILAAVIVIIVLSALVTWCINIIHRGNTINPEAKAQIDSLKRVIVSQKLLISGYNKKITDFQIQVDTLQSIKEANLEKINKLKNEYKNKASRVAAYDSDSLNSFFTDRYK